MDRDRAIAGPSGVGSAATERGRHIDVDMRVYVAHLDGQLHDIRSVAPADVYDRRDYAAGQALGRRLRTKGSNGIIYNSVRDEGGTCVAIFGPRLLTNCRQERHLTYQWDGSKIANVFEKRELQTPRGWPPA